jgi:hypothetical protein
MKKYHNPKKHLISLCLAAYCISTASSFADKMNIEQIPSLGFADEAKHMMHIAIKLSDVVIADLNETKREDLIRLVSPILNTKSCLMLNNTQGQLAYAKVPGGYLEVEIFDKAQQHISTIETTWDSCQ